MKKGCLLLVVISMVFGAISVILTEQATKNNDQGSSSDHNQQNEGESLPSPSPAKPSKTNQSGSGKKDSTATSIKITKKPIKTKKLKNGTIMSWADDWRKLDLGIVKVDEAGKPISNRNQYTAMSWLIENHKENVLKVDYIDQFASGSTFPSQVEYNRSAKTFHQIYVSTNVITRWKGIDADSFKGKTSWYWKKHKGEIDTSKRLVSALGKKPVQSEITSKVPCVVEYVKNNAHDSSSIKFIEWSKVSAMGKDWIVRAKYKGSNELGATVTQNAWFYIQYGKVVRTKVIE